MEYSKLISMTTPNLVIYLTALIILCQAVLQKNIYVIIYITLVTFVVVIVITLKDAMI